MPGPRYSKLETNSTGDDDLDFQSDMGRRHRSEKSNSLWLTTAVAFLLGIVVTLATINVWNHIGKRDTDWLRPPGDLKVQFQYNDTYPGPPTGESEIAWLDLLPDGLGAVQYDPFSDAIVTLSVFHQLHCLMALRHAVYNDWNETRHSHVTAHHSRHCLEYLRQSIMCNADTNLENRVVNENGLKETPGWDVKRCRDYSKTRAWAQSWRAFDGKIPSQKQEITDPDTLRGRVINY